MMTIRFRDNTYTFDNSDLHLQYFDSGDLHGNDNFRTQDKTWPVYEVLQRIDSTLLQSALAVTIDGRPLSLTAKIKKDCTLDIITADDAEGKIIYHYSLAYLIAQTVYAWYNNLQLCDISVSEQQCSLQFKLDSNSSNIADIIDKQLSQTIGDNTAIQIIDAFQKELLVETYPSLSQPYAKAFLEQYDDYDFVSVAVRNQFVLPVPESTVFVANPQLITDFTLTHKVENTTYTITAAQNHS